MIQRIQTVYYVIAVLLAAIALAFPIIDTAKLTEIVGANIPANETGNGLSAAMTPASVDSVIVKDGFWTAVAMLGACALLILLAITIVLFRSLRRQLFAGKIVLWVYLGMIGYYLLLAYVVKVKVQAFEASEVVWEGRMSLPLTLWFYFFAVGAAFVILGNMGVRKDRRLLDSLNRLR